MKQDMPPNKPGNSEDRLLEQLRKADSFQLPEGYFDGLEDRVLERIEATGLRRHTPMKALKKSTRRFSLPQLFMAVAAACALVLAAVWFFKPSDPVIAPVASVELSEEEIEDYVLQNVHDFDTEQLAMLPETDETENMPQIQQTPAPNHKKDPLEDISPEDVEGILNDMTDEELEEIL